MPLNLVYLGSRLLLPATVVVKREELRGRRAPNRTDRGSCSMERQEYVAAQQWPLCLKYGDTRTMEVFSADARSSIVYYLRLYVYLWRSWLKLVAMMLDRAQEKQGCRKSAAAIDYAAIIDGLRRGCR